ncbi:MAG: SNF2-related protein [Hymenobacter sp.]
MSVQLEEDADSYIFRRLLRSAKEENERADELRQHGLPLGSRGSCHPAQSGGVSLAARPRASPGRTRLSGAGRGFGQPGLLHWAGAGGRGHRGARRLVRRARHSLVWRVRGTVYPAAALHFAAPPRVSLAQRPESPSSPTNGFTNYLELFAFAEETDGQPLSLRRHHLSLIADLESDNLATVTLTRRLEKLRDFAAVEERPLPAGFRGTLRPYQHAGYNWLRFVQDYHLGGCLADDMGLGKSVQTLVMLMERKESGGTKGAASLLVLPTSLVHNWINEARKFTPACGCWPIPAPTAIRAWRSLPTTTSC